MKGLVLLTVITSIASTATGRGHAAPESVEVDAATANEPISPYIYGQFIEHLGRCIYGGIWAEMLEDRKFFYSITGDESGWKPFSGGDATWQGEGVPYEILAASPWQMIGSRDSVHMATDAPYVGEHDPVITVTPGQTSGIYHPRLGLLAGRRYTGHITLRATPGVASVEVALVWGDGPEGEQVVKITPAAEFQQYPVEFQSGGDTDDGRLAIRCHGDGEVRVGVVSLMPADNEEGFRKDTLALLRELDSPIYRWPGGNFVSGYDWRDGVGERDKRPPRKNPAWTGIEHNDVGLHEYLRLCELIEAEPFIALNTGLGDVTSSAAEVEYVTGDADTPEGKRRTENGRQDPWEVTWWAIGNEMYGDWQLGHMPLEEYVKKHNEIVDAIRAVSPSAKVIGVGRAGQWSETMLTHCADHMDLISEHLYWQRKLGVTEHVQVAVDQIQTLADAHRKYRETLSALAGKDIRIALDEWNYWYGPYIYGELGVRYFMRDALGAAAALHAMFRNSDLFYMANYAQTVNVIGAIKTTKTGAFIESTGLVLKLYRRHFGTLPVPVSYKIPGLDIAAAWTEDRGALTIGIVNTTGAYATVELRIASLTLPATCDAYVIQHANPDAHNDENAPATIAIKETKADLSNGAITVQPYSVTLVVLDH